MLGGLGLRVWRLRDVFRGLGFQALDLKGFRARVGFTSFLGSFRLRRV